MVRFEVIDHTADIGIAAYGNTFSEVFANAAYGMFSLITDPDTVNNTICRNVEIEATDKEELLVSWLNELLYLFDVENIIFNTFDVTMITWQRLHARVYGEKVDLARHRIKTSVKAATYHMISVEKKGDGFQIRVILDI